MALAAATLFTGVARKGRAGRSYPDQPTELLPKMRKILDTTTTAMLEKAGTAHEVVEARYADYGAAIAEEIDTGFVQAAVSKWGNVLGVTIVGEGSGEMINQWGTVMQNRLSLVRLLMQQHSFPTMGFLSKRIAEIWLMGKMRSNLVRNICRKLF